MQTVTSCPQAQHTWGQWSGPKPVHFSSMDTVAPGAYIQGQGWKCIRQCRKCGAVQTKILSESVKI